MLLLVRELFRLRSDDGDVLAVGGECCWLRREVQVTLERCVADVLFSEGGMVFSNLRKRRVVLVATCWMCRRRWPFLLLCLNLSNFNLLFED